MELQQAQAKCDTLKAEREAAHAEAEKLADVVKAQRQRQKELEEVIKAGKGDQQALLQELNDTRLALQRSEADTVTARQLASDKAAAFKHYVETEPPLARSRARAQLVSAAPVDHYQGGRNKVARLEGASSAGAAIDQQLYLEAEREFIAARSTGNHLKGQLDKQRHANSKLAGLQSKLDEATKSAEQADLTIEQGNAYVEKLTQELKSGEGDQAAIRVQLREAEDLVKSAQQLATAARYESSDARANLRSTIQLDPEARRAAAYDRFAAASLGGAAKFAQVATPDSSGAPSGDRKTMRHGAEYVGHSAMATTTFAGPIAPWRIT
jgi:hypothetical protein